MLYYIYYQILNVGSLSPKITTVNSDIGVGGLGSLWSLSYLIIWRWWYAGFLPSLIDSTLPMTICRCQTVRPPLHWVYQNVSYTVPHIPTFLVQLWPGYVSTYTGAIKWSIYWTSRVCHPSTYQITCGRVVAGTHWTGINAEPGRGRITSIVFLKFWFEAILH